MPEVRTLERIVLERRTVSKATVAFAFMLLLAAQTATGFMHVIFAGVAYPRAMRALDALLATFVTGPLGRTGGTATLLILGVIFAALILRRRVAKVGS